MLGCYLEPFERYLALLAAEAEDFRVEIPGRSTDFDFVPNPPQEGVVAQVARIEVRGENHQLLERNRKFLASGQGDIVNAIFERQDPAVEQVSRRDDLAAEVVDHEHAAVGLHLQRSDIEVARLIES